MIQSCPAPTLKSDMRFDTSALEARQSGRKSADFGAMLRGRSEGGDDCRSIPDARAENRVRPAAAARPGKDLPALPPADEAPDDQAAAPEAAPRSAAPELAAIALEPVPGLAQVAPPAGASTPIGEGGTAEGKASAEPHAPGVLQRNVPALPQAASVKAQAIMEQHRAEAAPAQAPSPADAQGREPKPAAPAPSEEVRIAVSMPRSQRTVSQFREGRAVPEAASDASGASIAAPPSQPQGAAAATVSPAGPVRPHDFAALVERLSAAREALAPQPVSLTVAHPEFGPVRLRFHPDEAGLSVSMSSADPAFARAAAASPLPVPTAGASDQTGSALHQGGEHARPQAGSGGSPDQRREPGQQRRESTHLAQSDLRATLTRAGAGAPRGIFA